MIQTPPPEDGRSATPSSGADLTAVPQGDTVQGLAPVGITELGLSSQQVEQRVEAGLVNATSGTSSRALTDILRTNLFTRFNAILGSLFVVALIVGPPQDGLFGLVLLLNTVLGIAQEWHAKKTLDRLAVLHAASAHAVREGVTVEIHPDHVVIDDILEIRTGDQIVADGIVLATQAVEIDESLLTGESNPITKEVSDEVLSGSVVVGGSARIRVIRVGPEAFGQRIQGEAQRFSLVRSELQQGTNRLLQMITWVLVPTALLLAVSQIVRSGLSIDEALRGTIAGVGAMVPEGLVLLTTIAFALGAVRLAGRRVLVQELAAIEGLARVDVLCIDKTGTLTDTTMGLLAVEPLGELPAREALGALAAADPAPNATMRAIGALPDPGGWAAAEVMPFSSARMWSAVQFRDHGTWVLGAPDVVEARLQVEDEDRVRGWTGEGHRVLLLARTEQALGGEALPTGMLPAAFVLLGESIRPEAHSTIAYLREQGVSIKILSGDDPATVGAVGIRVGVAGSEMPVDARLLSDGAEDLAREIELSSVFGRVQPEQKREFVLALQANGHVVAMTGDGVNDVAAVKAADLGIAMGSGSAATRAVARIVLLDDAFGVVPQVLHEGRRVIANVQRVANLFVTKSVYAALLAIVVGIFAVPYPFYPRHLTIVSTFTIGLPGFFLAFAPGAPRAEAGFLARVLRFTLPAGIVSAGVALSAYFMTRWVFHAKPAEARTTTTLALLLIGLAVLALVCRPMTWARGALVAAMALMVLPLWLIPVSRSVFGLATPPLSALLAVLAAVAVGAVALAVLVRSVETRQSRRRS